MNRVSTMSPYLASGRTSRRSAARRRDISILPLLRTLGAVFRPALAAVLDALGVQGAADDVVANAGQILDATAADHDHRVFLEIVALAGNVARDLEGVGQPHARDLAQRRVRLLRRRGVDAGAHAALLRARLQRRHLVARPRRLPGVADQLVDRRHTALSFETVGQAKNRAK